MHEYRGLVLHIAEGYYEGTISWQHNPGNRVSSHFVAGRDSGEIAQLVDTDQAAWTQLAGNGHWLSLECAGFTPSHPLHKPGWEKLTAWQISIAARLLVRMHQQYATPIQLATTSSGRGLGHHSMGGADWGHPDCPGPAIIGQKAEILASAKTMATDGETMTKLDIENAVQYVLEEIANAALPTGDPAKRADTTQLGRNGLIFVQRIADNLAARAPGSGG